MRFLLDVNGPYCFGNFRFSGHKDRALPKIVCVASTYKSLQAVVC